MMINLDANANYGLLDGMADKVCSALGQFSNPSALHRGGQKAKYQIEKARDSLAAAVDLSFSDSIFFTSGATEANNTALSLPLLRRRGNAAVLLSNVEHPSVLEMEGRLLKSGIRVEKVSTSQIRACEVPEGPFSLCSIMFANNETGEILPVKDYVRAVRAESPHCVFHCDGVQSLGKAKIGFPSLGVDMLSLSAHKAGGFTGVGALVCRPGFEVEALLKGGPQEQRRRAGTENLPGIISFGYACEKVTGSLQQRIDAMSHSKKVLQQEILNTIPDSYIHFRDVPTLPNTLSVHFPGCRSDDLLIALDMKGVMVSAGSACASGKPEGSHVLRAEGLPEEVIHSTLRLSFRADLSTDQIEKTVQALKDAVSVMRR